MSKVFTEQHSTKQREDALAWGLPDDGEMLRMTQEVREDDRFSIDEDMYRWVTCPSLIFVGDNDDVAPPETSRKIAELTGGELHVILGAGHGLHARFRANLIQL